MSEQKININVISKNPEITLGQNEDFAVKIHLQDVAHLFISGVTGCGKTKIIENILLETIKKSSPKFNKFFVINTRGLDYFDFEDNAFLPLGTVLAEDAYATALLLQTVMNERFNKLRQKKVSNITKYNELSDDNNVLPHLYLVIDDYSGLLTYSYAMEDVLKNLAYNGRATGIHLIIVSSLSSVAVVPNEIQGNIVTRIAGKTFPNAMFSRALGVGSDTESDLFKNLKDSQEFIINNNGKLSKFDSTTISQTDSLATLTKYKEKFPLNSEEKIDDISLSDYKKHLVDMNLASWTDDNQIYLKPQKRKKSFL
jgi:hypothetical protein